MADGTPDPGANGNATKVESIHADTAGYLAAKVIPAVSGFLAIVVLTRTIEPSLYARYSVLLTASLLGSYLGGAWLCQAVLYYYPTNKPAAGTGFELFSLQIQVRLLAAGALLYWGIIFFVLQDLALSMVSALHFSFFILYNLFLAFAQSARRIRIQIVAVIVQSVVHLVLLVVALAWLGKNDVAAITLICIAQGAAVLVLLFDVASRARSTGQAVSDQPDHNVREMITFGMPLSIWFLAYQFTLFGDRFVLGRVGRLGELGSYAAWRDLATGVTGFLTMPLLMAAHPAILMLWKKGGNRFQIEEMMQSNREIIITLFCPIIALVFMAGPVLLPWTMGASFTASTFVLVATLLTLLISALNMYNHKGLELLAQTRRMAGLALVLALVSLLLNLVLAPAYGASGTVAVSLVIQLIYAFASTRMGKPAVTQKLDKVFLLRSLGWTILVCAAGVLATACLPLDVRDLGRVLIGAGLMLLLTIILISQSTATSVYLCRLHSFWKS